MHEEAFEGCKPSAIPSDIKVKWGLEGLRWYDQDTVSAVILEGVTELSGEYSFQDCEKLETVTLPSSLEVIGERAFRECSSLRGELTLPDSLKRIEDGAFCYCSNLESIHFPAASSLLEFVHEKAFIGCKPSAIPSDIKEKWNLVF